MNQPTYFVHPPEGYANVGRKQPKNRRKLGYAILATIFVLVLILGICYMTGVLGTGEANLLPTITWSR